MDIYRLLSDELAYELLIRNLSLGTVQENRARLSRALQKETSAPLSIDWPIAKEFDICNQKLVNLANDICNFNTENRVKK